MVLNLTKNHTHEMISIFQTIQFMSAAIP